MNKKELEERLINFAVLIIEIANELPNTKVGNHLSGQLVRSGTSSALNYGEAQSGESRKDFIHKIKIVLKELRETHINLRIMKVAGLAADTTTLDELILENNELIAIFTKTLFTARANSSKKN